MSAEQVLMILILVKFGLPILFCFAKPRGRRTRARRGGGGRRVRIAPARAATVWRFK